MKIIVTGGAGFIGSHVVDRLLAEGHEVHCIDDFYLGKQAHVDLQQGNPKYHFTKLDVNEQDALNQIFATFQPEAVFHLAANSDIASGSEDMAVDMHRTFGTSVAVLNAIKKTPSVNQLIFASTSAVYGSLPYDITESTGPLIPQSNYGAGKLASEAFIDAYAHTHNLKTWIFRFPNVCGPRATHGVFYNFVKFLDEDPTQITVAQDGKQAKPYIYVLDLVDAIMLGWQKGGTELINAYNVGNEPLVSVNEILHFLLEEFGIHDIKINYTGAPAWPGDVPTYTYDYSKIKNLGYSPRFNATEAAHETAKELVKALRASKQ